MVCPRSLAPILAPLLSILAAACSSGGSGPAPEPTPKVDPSTFGVSDVGPFTCGHRVLETTYAQPAGQPMRTIPVHVWYPSTSTDGEHARYKGIFVDTVAWEDGALAPSAFSGGYPVLLHSHGYQGFAGNSARLMCHFASHGWLAVAPEHVGNTLIDTPDPLPLAMYYQRPLDMRAALDFIDHLPEGDALAGKADLAQIGVSGHSFGTYTAWAEGGAAFDLPTFEAKCDAGDLAACDAAGLAVFETDLSEKRAKAIMPLAGGPSAYFGKSGYDAVKVPVLLMSGTLDKVKAEEIFDGVKGVDLSWVEVEGGCHQLYGLGNTFKGADECTVLPDEEGFGIVNPILLAFARYHVLGERGDEVTGLALGTKGLSPKAHFQHTK